MRAASVGGGPTGLCSGVERIDVAARRTSMTRQSVRGHAVHSHFSNCIREVGFPTTAAGNVDAADYVDSLLLTGRADYCCLDRPHLATADAPSAAPLGDHLTAAAMPRTRSALPPAARAIPATEGV